LNKKQVLFLIALVIAINICISMVFFETDALGAIYFMFEATAIIFGVFCWIVGLVLFYCWLGDR